MIYLYQQKYPSCFFNDQKNSNCNHVNSLCLMTAKTCRTAASSFRLLMASESKDELTSVKKALKETFKNKYGY